MELTDEQIARLKAIQEALQKLATSNPEARRAPEGLHQYKPYPEMVDQHPHRTRKMNRKDKEEYYRKYGEAPPRLSRTKRSWIVEDSTMESRRAGSSPGEMSNIDKVMRVPLAWQEDGISVTTHEMGHAAWSPDSRPEMSFPDILTEVFEDARINLGLERKGMPMQIADETRGIALKMMESDARRGDPVSVILRAIAGSGTDGEPYAQSAVAKLPYPWSEFGQVWTRRVRALMTIEADRIREPVPPFSTGLGLARRFDTELKELIQQETEREAPGMAPGEAPTRDEDGYRIGDPSTPDNPTDVPLYQNQDQILSQERDEANTPERTEREAANLRENVERYRQAAKVEEKKNPGRAKDFRDSADRYEEQARELEAQARRQRMERHRRGESTTHLPEYTPIRREFGKSLARSFVIDGDQNVPMDLSGMMNVGYGGSFDSDSEWLLGSAMEAFDKMGDSDPNAPSYRHLIKMRNMMARPGDMRIATPPLTEPMPMVARGRAKRPAASDEGTMIRRPDRLVIDRAIFQRKRQRRGVSVLVDTSGSMSLDLDDVERIVLAAGGDALVAIYSGQRESGELRIVARDSMRVPKALFERYGGNNVVDLPALEWLAKQPAPRVWVSDGCVTGVGDNGDLYLQGLCFDLCARHNIERVEHVTEALDYLENLR